MIDAFGNQLDVNDRVAVVVNGTNSSNTLVKGVVTKVTDKSITYKVIAWGKQLGVGHPYGSLYELHDGDIKNCQFHHRIVRL